MPSDLYLPALTFSTFYNSDISGVEAHIRLPTSTKRVGRPKGTVTTVIGLPKKKSKVQCVTFLELDPVDQKKGLLCIIHCIL